MEWSYIAPVPLTLLEVTQDYALVQPLFSEHKIRPPPGTSQWLCFCKQQSHWQWIRAWIETGLSMNNMTKEDLKVWTLVKSRLAEDKA